MHLVSLTIQITVAHCRKHFCPEEILGLTTQPKRSPGPKEYHTRSLMVMFAAFVLPLVVRDKLPYYNSPNHGLILLDTGSARSFLKSELLESDEVIAVAGRKCETQSPDALSLPPFCEGIAGFDLVSELGERVVFDILGQTLHIDEPLPESLTECLEMTRSKEALIPCQVYGIESCDVSALVDTGSPSTIANSALDLACGLFDDDLAAEAATTSTNADGSVNRMRKKRCAGLRIANSVDRQGLQIYVADLPAMKLVDRHLQLLLGLDALGNQFAFEFVQGEAVAAEGTTTPRRKTRRTTPSQPSRQKSTRLWLSR